MAVGAGMVGTVGRGMVGIEIRLLRRHHLGKEDLYCPVFVCDACYRPIVEQGNYEHKIGQNGEPVGGVYFTHKGCSERLRQMNNGRSSEHWLWDDLKHFPIRLYTNFADTEMLSGGPLSLYLYTLGVKASGFVEISDQKLKVAGLYFLYEEDEIVYIGQSQNISSRLASNHHVYKPHHRIRIAPIGIQKHRDEAEKALIFLLRPLLNKVHNSMQIDLNDLS